MLRTRPVSEGKAFDNIGGCAIDEFFEFLISKVFNLININLNSSMKNKTTYNQSRQKKPNN